MPKHFKSSLHNCKHFDSSKFPTFTISESLRKDLSFPLLIKSIDILILTNEIKNKYLDDCTG
jgi:hypothetical protein